MKDLVKFLALFLGFYILGRLVPTVLVLTANYPWMATVVMILIATLIFLFLRKIYRQ